MADELTRFRAAVLEEAETLLHRVKGVNWRFHCRTSIDGFRTISTDEFAEIGPLPNGLAVASRVVRKADRISSETPLLNPPYS